MDNMYLEISDVRRDLGLTQKEFAELTGFKLPTYILKERNNAFTGDELFRICDTLSLDIKSIEIRSRSYRKETE